MKGKSSFTSILDKQEAWLDTYAYRMRFTEQGQLVSVGDGIAWVSGLPSARMNGLVVFADGSRAMVFDLAHNKVGAVLLDESNTLTSGMPVFLAHEQLCVPCGKGVTGRVVDSLGRPLDGQGDLVDIRYRAIEQKSPPIIARDFVQKPLYSGIKAIDTLIPIGKGQRQLLIGDEGVGRSALAIDTVLNQRGGSVKCIYVLVGQKRSTVINTINTLRRYGALEYTAVVVAIASSLPGMQYLAPFSGCAMAEEWMYKGSDTLVIYDDLSTHAKIYRELSLLLRHPPGREAYPGDIFSIQARLLERSTTLSLEHGGGSMTALPIVETEQGEIASYIPTNLISITDGQIYLDQNLFASGLRPAIDIARSVSRIGGQAQHPKIKAEAGKMKLDYLQFLELEVFTRFGTRLEPSMEKAIYRGRILREILKQEQLHPLPIEFQMAWLVAYNSGLFDSAELNVLSGIMQHLQQQVQLSGLRLEDDREKWLSHLRSWITVKSESEHDEQLNEPISQG
ncbi:F0F1 ATP synthase subunit alpha [Desulfopila sp. IMCC35008]|uniref:F0F1 ATP synthase subunit alpha n=1 Tax=Desulfopila sp. IMCC35008 TaxID=2653858 RepID=UPI0013D47A21|nr:F0F1 ATP synthase subunit alpha [Desulfopila sp. IMCC35008]